MRYLIAFISLLFVFVGCVQPAQPEQEEIDYLKPVALAGFDDALAARITQLTVLELQDAMEAGELSAEQVTAFYIGQIEAKNEVLNAVIAVNPGAIEAAKALDAERAAGTIRGVLHGIPVLIKDNIETIELPTTAGSLALKDNQTDRDAFVITRLREEGAIILGKANLSEWANFRSERSSSGWSGVGGQTRNPHDITRSPCGSSSGSGAGVAGLLAPIALGTETNGSVTCPSSLNGIVGIKPTVGLVSRTGIVPISHSQDTAGPMTRSVTDAAVLLQAMRGFDPADDATAPLQSSGEVDYLAALDAEALSGKRIGVIRSNSGYHEGVSELLDGAIATLEAAGVTIVDDLKVDPYTGFYGDTYNILLYEFKADLNAYLAGLPNELSALTLAQLIDYNTENAEAEMPHFQQEIFEKSEEKGPLTDTEYLEALEKAQKETRETIEAFLADNNLDALIAATHGGPAGKIDLMIGDHFMGGGYSTYSAVSGYPHITVPMGNVGHMPVGLSFIGDAFSEAELIALAYAYEQQ